MLCVAADEGIDLIYTFEKDGFYCNLRVPSIPKEAEVPSLQGMFFGLFPFENEAHDLFGVNIVDMALDFEGAFYDVAVSEPMTVISPEKKAQREKAAKLAKAQAAKAAREAAAAGEGAPAGQAAEKKEGE